MNLKLLGAIALLLVGFAGSAAAEWPPGTATPHPSTARASVDDAHKMAAAAVVNRSVALDRCARMSGDERLTCNEQALRAARIQSGDAAAASIHQANALGRCASMAGDERAACQAQAGHDATVQAGIDRHARAPK